MSHTQKPSPLTTLNASIAPDAERKAEHIAAAMAAFEQAQATTAKKISPERQGFWARLRLTRDNSHGRDPMNSTPFWKSPIVLSGVAASSLAVIIGVNLLPQHTPEHLAIESREQVARLEVADTASGNVQAHTQAYESTKMMAAAAARQSAELQKVSRQVMPAPAMAAMQMRLPEYQAPQPQYRDRFDHTSGNPVIATADNPVSTFSIDVDTAAYSYARRMLNQGQLPAKDAVRLEEMVNYFSYDYPQPASAKQPFSTRLTLLDSPWKPGNKLLHIGIQGYQLPAADIPQANLVFLLDVSGSMSEPSKLPLVKQSMELLLGSLKPSDTIALVVYAGAAGVVLEPTAVREKNKILSALHKLEAGGSTAGGEGLALAYQLAEQHFNAKGVNRIILATDGDFNVGQTGDENLQDFVERKRKKGIYLSILGFGQGNYQDALMQKLAQNGNGTAAYIDTLGEAQKVLVDEAQSTLFPIAQDVKIQVEFNPAKVAEYRLLGYETRALAQEDFNNDKVDAGEVGAGQRVTAIYEITPVGANSGLLPPTRYLPSSANNTAASDEYAMLRLRYKLPGEAKSQLQEQAVGESNHHAGNANSEQLREAQFAIAVAGFAQLLKGGKYTGNYSYDQVIDLAQANKGDDRYGYRSEFIQLVRKAKLFDE